MAAVLLKLLVKDKLPHMAAETPKERKRRLQQKNTRERERMAAGTPEEIERATESHHDFCVRRSVVLCVLQWLLTSSIYYQGLDWPMLYDTGVI